MTRVDPEAVMAYAREANRDPDRRRPGPPHPGFAPFPRGSSVAICHNCGAVIPDSPEWIQQHIAYESRRR